MGLVIVEAFPLPRVNLAENDKGEGMDQAGVESVVQAFVTAFVALGVVMVVLIAGVTLVEGITAEKASFLDQPLRAFSPQSPSTLRELVAVF